ncbi:hypothetical protein [Streptomyces sp. DG2A-72]|uniref:hypothetical protein n=1 Tax=Streptomyces sp. DG2A-72 TaxID=3051386 RepID=UPI0034644CFF
MGQRVVAALGGEQLVHQQRGDDRAAPVDPFQGLDDQAAPDVALVDLDLDGENGFDVARLLTGKVPAVILVSTHFREDFQELIAASPARGFLHKSALSAHAIQEVLGNDGSGAPT